MHSETNRKARTMKAIELAPYFIAKAYAAGDGITNKKLQKLLYYVKAWGLVYFADGIIDDDFEAWVHGPVCPEVYVAYKDFGYNNIITDFGEKTADEFIEYFRENILKKICKDMLDLIDAVFTKYGSLTSLHLELLTHQEQPWVEARSGLAPCDTSHNIINPDTMRTFYSA